jgi:response regulator NasT
MSVATKERCKVLLVDDDRLVLATLSAGLRQANYSVVEAANGDVALRAIANEEPDIALLDMRMPGLSGIEVAQRIREQRDLPCVFLSAYGDDEVVRDAAAAGAFGYLVKPVDVAQVIPALEAALARSQEMRKLKQTETQLNSALAARREASMAIGILMERLHLDRDEAFDALRDYARANRRKLADVAAELLDAAETMNQVIAHHQSRAKN